MTNPLRHAVVTATALAFFLVVFSKLGMCLDFYSRIAVKPWSLL